MFDFKSALTYQTIGKKELDLSKLSEKEKQAIAAIQALADKKQKEKDFEWWDLRSAYFQKMDELEAWTKTPETRAIYIDIETRFCLALSERKKQEEKR
jgi:hypothetical protein